MTTVNEGFWDALVNKARTAKLAAGRMVGNQKASGALSANNLATQFYDSYKHHLGASGGKYTQQGLIDFLGDNVGMDGNFAKKAGVEYGRFLADPTTYFNEAGKPEAEESPQAAEGQPKDGELRKFFLNIAQQALKTGAAKTAAQRQVTGIPSNLKKKEGGEQQVSQEAPQAAPEPQQAPAATPAAPAQAPAHAPAPTPSPAPAPVAAPAAPLTGTNVPVGQINLDDQELNTLRQLNTQLGTPGVVQTLQQGSKDPELAAIAKKIMTGALQDFLAKQPDVATPPKPNSTASAPVAPPKTGKTPPPKPKGPSPKRKR